MFRALSHCRPAVSTAQNVVLETTSRIRNTWWKSERAQRTRTTKYYTRSRVFFRRESSRFSDRDATGIVRRNRRSPPPRPDAWNCLSFPARSRHVVVSIFFLHSRTIVVGPYNTLTHHKQYIYTAHTCGIRVILSYSCVPVASVYTLRTTTRQTYTCGHTRRHIDFFDVISAPKHKIIYQQ